MPRGRPKKNKEEPQVAKPTPPPPAVDKLKIPEVLVDGGLVYRFCYDLRKELMSEKKPNEQAVHVCNEVMDYVIRMDKDAHRKNPSQ